MQVKKAHTDSDTVTYPEVPNAHLAPQTAWGEDVIVGGVEGQTPGCAWVASQNVCAFTRGYLRHTHSVVTMGRGNLGSETHQQYTND